MCDGLRMGMFANQWIESPFKVFLMCACLQFFFLLLSCCLFIIDTVLATSIFANYLSTCIHADINRKSTKNKTLHLEKDSRINNTLLQSFSHPFCCALSLLLVCLLISASFILYLFFCSPLFFFLSCFIFNPYPTHRTCSLPFAPSLYRSLLLSICQSLYLARICSLSLSSPVQYWSETSNLLFYLRHSSRIYEVEENILFFQFCILYLKCSGFQDYDICIKGNEWGKKAFDQLRSRGFLFFLVLIHMSCVIGSLKTGSHILRKSDCTFSLFILDHMFKMWLKGMSQANKSDLYCGQMNIFFFGGVASQTMKGSNVSFYFIEI